MHLFSKRRIAADKVGFASPICELKEYSVTCAIAYAANTDYQDVHVSSAFSNVVPRLFETAGRTLIV